MPDTVSKTSPDDTLNVPRGSIVIPPFWKKKPETWFRQIEAKFRMAGITEDQEKFDHVLGNLDSTIVDAIDDFFNPEPAENKYEALKTRLIRESTDSEKEDDTKLLKVAELSDQKPSAILPRDFLPLVETVFVQRVPEMISAILTASQLKNEVQRAEKTVQSEEAKPQLIQEEALTSDTQTAKADNEIASFHKEIIKEFRKINQRMDGLEKRRTKTRSRSSSLSNFRSYRSDYRLSSRSMISRSRSPIRRSRSPIRSPGPDPDLDDYCWYHRRYKSSAIRCKSPCAFFSKLRK